MKNRMTPLLHGFMAPWCWASLLAMSAGALAQDQVQAQSVPRSAWHVPTDDAIRKLLAERMEHNGVGMVVGVIEPQGRRVVVHGRSWARNGRPLDGDTIFQIGSVTKVFTTLLLADMVRRGEVALDDPAQKYLPLGVRMPERGRPVTLFDLATHTSGLPSMPDNFQLRGEPEPYAAYTVGQLHDFLAGYQPDRAPGEKWDYSNLGVALLGRLLASRMEMDYQALLKQRVLDPHGMRSTAIVLTPRQSARLAPGHDRFLQPVITWEMRTLPASGSLRSSANDLLRFLGAYLGFQQTSLKQAMALQLSTRAPVRNAQALGWGSSTREDAKFFVHEGAKAGYRAVVAFDPQARVGVVVLANANTDERLGPIAAHLLVGRALPPAVQAPLPRAIVTPDSRLLEAYEGRYQLAPDTVITVVRKGGHLLVDFGGDGGSEFSATSDRDFFLNVGTDEITFQVDANGSVTGLTHYGKGRDSAEYESAQRIQ